MTFWEVYDPLDPSNNNQPPPAGAPEGMLGKELNDSMRQAMSAIGEVGEIATDTTRDLLVNSLTATNGVTVGTSVNRPDSLSTLFISGGTDQSDGGNAVYYGATHPSSPNRVLFRNGTANVLDLNPATRPTFTADIVDFRPATANPKIRLSQTAAEHVVEFQIHNATNQRVASLLFDGPSNTLALRLYDPAGPVQAGFVLSNGIVNVDVGELQEGGQRVYSPNNPPPP